MIEILKLNFSFGYTNHPSKLCEVKHYRYCDKELIELYEIDKMNTPLIYLNILHMLFNVDFTIYYYKIFQNIDDIFHNKPDIHLDDIGLTYQYNRTQLLIWKIK